MLLTGFALVWLTLLAAYGIRVALAGRFAHERAEKEPGSPLLGRFLIEFGYWAFSPLAKACHALGVTPHQLTGASLVASIAAAFAVGLAAPLSRAPRRPGPRGGDGERHRAAALRLHPWRAAQARWTWRGVARGSAAWLDESRHHRLGHRHRHRLRDLHGPGGDRGRVHRHLARGRRAARGHRELHPEQAVDLPDRHRTHLARRSALR